MKKRLMACLLAIVLLMTLLPAALAEEEGEGEPMDLDLDLDLGAVPEDIPADLPEEESEAQPLNFEELLGYSFGEWPKTMYVYTENRGTLNVRSEPQSGSNVVDRLDYGTEVIVEGPVVINTDWSCIRNRKAPGGIGYVMTRYLSNYRPSDADRAAEDKERKANLEELNRQLKSARTLETPLMLAVRASRASGWVNFRVGPGVAADRIASLPDGRSMKAIGETDKWYQAIDLETGKIGYISKNYVTVLGAVKEEPAAVTKSQMGKLNVNGEFAIQCQLPDGYTMQMINSMGTKINAFISSADKEKPVLQLSIAFDELFVNVDRMNDLTEEALQGLEASFKEMNDVTISYQDTAYGTKLLIAREVGNDTDFVDILSVYKGYSIEFVMTPSPNATNKTLTDAQVQMCIDFLSELDFVPAV